MSNRALPFGVQRAMLTLVVAMFTAIPLVGPGLMALRGLQIAWKSTQSGKTLALYVVMMGLWFASICVVIWPNDLIQMLSGFKFAEYYWSDDAPYGPADLWKITPFLIYISTCVFMAVQHIRLAIKYNMHIGVITEFVSSGDPEYQRYK